MNASVTLRVMNALMAIQRSKDCSKAHNYNVLERNDEEKYDCKIKQEGEGGEEEENCERGKMVYLNHAHSIP